MKKSTNISCLKDTEYRGISSDESDILIGDFISNKEKIVQAIINKSGEADITDSMKNLAEKINKLLPAKPVFKSNISFNPYWHNLNEVAGNNFKSEMPHMWILLFSKAVKTIQLAGAESYLCSDGFYTTETQEHNFIENNDEYDTSWVIFYGKEPQYTFANSLKGYVQGLLFYDVPPSGVYINGLSISTFIQFIKYENLIINTSSWAQGNSISTILFENVKSINFLVNCFQSNTNLKSFPIPEGVENLTISGDSFALSGIKRFITPHNIKSLSVSNAFGSCPIEEFIVNDSPDAVVDIGKNGYPFNKSTIKFIKIGKVKELTLGGAVFYFANNMKEIHLESPVEKFIWNPSRADIPNITFGKDWNHSANLVNFTNQTTESMYQNIQALADRTGLSTLTLTFGAAKLNTLLAEHPDAAQIATDKNWKLA